jgi:hypothetical protein
VTVALLVIETIRGVIRLLVKVSVPAIVASVPEVGNVTAVVPVLVMVVGNAPDVANVEPSASVNVAEVAGAVMATLLTLVAVAAPEMVKVPAVGVNVSVTLLVLMLTGLQAPPR